MGKVYDELTEPLQVFIRKQHLFFVGTAPLAGDGLVNVSPKGFDTLRILDAKTIAYLDLMGSGIETMAHLKENGRMVMMFCSFDARPMILRLHGTGQAIEQDNPEFDELIGLFPELVGTRSIIKLNIERIADSCGWGVPRYAYEGERDTYRKFAEKAGDEGIRKGQLASNMKSLDGLIGLSKPTV
jgi:hypothetical protein